MKRFDSFLGYYFFRTSHVSKIHSSISSDLFGYLARPSLYFFNFILLHEEKLKMKRLNAIVVGATGATGLEIVARLLEDKAFKKVSSCSN